MGWVLRPNCHTGRWLGIVGRWPPTADRLRWGGSIRIEGRGRWSRRSARAGPLRVDRWLTRSPAYASTSPLVVSREHIANSCPHGPVAFLGTGRLARAFATSKRQTRVEFPNQTLVSRLEMRNGCGRRLAIHKGHTVDEIAYVVAQPDRIEGDVDVAAFGVSRSDDSVDPVSPCVLLCSASAGCRRRRRT